MPPLLGRDRGPVAFADAGRFAGGSVRGDQAKRNEVGDRFVGTTSAERGEQLADGSGGVRVGARHSRGNRGRRGLREGRGGPAGARVLTACPARPPALYGAAVMQRGGRGPLPAPL